MFKPMEFRPSLYEVEQANQYFWEQMKKHAGSIMLPESEPAHMSMELAIRCAAANVWEHARMYQAEKEEKVKEEVKELNDPTNLFKRFNCIFKYTLKSKMNRGK